MSSVLEFSITDPVAKAKALEDQAKVRGQERRDEKRRVWKLLQERYPDQAEFLKSINDTFGKPARVEIYIPEGERIV